MIMKCLFVPGLALVHLLAVVLPAAASLGIAMTLDDLRNRFRQKEHFVLPDPDELAAAKELFSRMLGDEALDPDLARAAGLDLVTPEGYQVAADRIDAPTGRGFHVLRRDGLPLLLSAPHQFRDLGTGLIATRMFEESAARGLSLNTAPRDLPVPGRSPLSDLADLHATHFNAFHVAFHRAHPGGRIVQLHGFAQEKRKSREGRSADVILSSGEADPGDGIPQIAACLSSMGLRARVYPREVTELGGTTNATLAALRAAGAPVGSFVHLEMSAATRETLRKDPDARFVLATCLGVGL